MRFKILYKYFLSLAVVDVLEKPRFFAVNFYYY